ncbi:hypothetical protein [Ideonella paludis]|uniref:Uncharacterized protein n=1 Tax=Ideonella paludis TaxID=1233411 RepID=A0ABS5DYV0_9BURK|nr:hypothetical protein [Ideonella paludis]MBQ0936327.1 hypothetical protein [Ideonella paludis]
MKTHLIVSAALVALSVVSVSASAAIKSATFRTESNLPIYGTGAPLVLSKGSPLVAGADELTGAHVISNPDGWGGGIVHMDLDKTTNILTLKAQDNWDFQTFHASVGFVRFTNATESICGIKYLGGNITTPAITPSATFVDNGVSISYVVQDVSGGGYFNFVMGATAQFQIETCVPRATEKASVPGRNH